LVVKVNGRQNAYRSAESIGRILEEHGKACPKCERFSYSQGFYSAGYILIGANPFDPHAKDKLVVCDRCRSFGRILNLQATDFLNYAHYTYALRQIISATDCPT
jgi:hypothetical protein